MAAKREKKCQIDDASSVVVHPALKEYFTYRFYKLALRLRAEVNEALQKHGVLGIQLGLLKVLQIDGPESQISLGRNLGIDKATMVKLLDDLERNGLILRISVLGDRRVKHIRITPKGIRLLRTGSQIRETVEKRFFKILSSRERKVLDRSLSKLLG